MQILPLRSFCLAAKELNRKFIGIEKEPKYYEVAEIEKQNLKYRTNDDSRTNVKERTNTAIAYSRC